MDQWTIGTLVRFLQDHGRDPDGSITEAIRDVRVMIAVPKSERPLRMLDIAMVYDATGTLIRCELRELAG